MKTSIIVSTFAAILLMITFAETTSVYIAKNENTTSVSNYSYIPSTLADAKPAIYIAAAIKNKIATEAARTSIEDLSYLKFDAADYINTEVAADLYSENSLDYLKFNVNDYTTGETNSRNESTELPVSDFDYLKFDASDYSNNQTATDESIEQPVNNFDYLKFDVNEYANDHSSSDELSDPAANDFDYLRFDVTQYAENNHTYEVPVSE